MGAVERGCLRMHVAQRYPRFSLRWKFALNHRRCSLWAALGRQTGGVGSNGATEERRISVLLYL
jgi:hypothetical protein